MIEVRGLTARTRDAVLLDGVDLAVPAGGVTALVGPSGSGKTTTALALLGEAAPGVRLRGSVTVGGVAVVDELGVTREAAMLRGRTIAYMPQHPGSALNPARRTGAVLRELAALHRPGSSRQEIAAAALEQAQLPAEKGVLRRFPHQFSGGQRQRVALAQVLACGPRALVLDEPGTGLDAVTRMGVADRIAALARDGMAVLLLSHDHDLVRTLAGHVVLLAGGRVAGQGAPADLLPDRPVPPWEGGAPGRPRLAVDGLTAWLRPGRRGEVLREVAFALAEGECVAVVGPSGSGKTTLARCIAGLHERRTGRIALDGADLPPHRRRDTAGKRRVQYVWQEVRGSFDDRRTVLDQVARTAVRLRGRSRAAARDEAADLLERLGVAAETARRTPAALSGGELQRAAFARAALAEPDVLICDEITSALDDDATRRVLAELGRMRRERAVSVLWIGHDLRLLPAVAERVIVLDGGRIAAEGDRSRVVDIGGATSRRELERLKGADT